MNKYAKISVYFIIVSIFIFFIFFIFSLFILPSGSSVDSPQQSTPKITRTASTETSCNNGVCITTLYSGTMFENNGSEWLPLSEIIDFTWTGNEFKLSYKNNPNVYIVLQPYFNYANGNNYTVQDIKAIFPNAKLKDKIQLGNFNYKFALNLTVPQNLVDNTNYIAFKLTEVNGLTWGDVAIENKTVIIKGKYRMDFNDLIESGFTLSRVGREFRIGNLSANYVSGTLFLDPTIQLQDNETENLEDIRILNGTSGDQYSLIKFDISSVPLGATIEDARLYLYKYSDFGFPDDDINWYRINNQSWTEDDSHTTLYNLRDLLTNFTTDSNKFGGSGWDWLNVTAMVQIENDLNNPNASFWFEDPDHNTTGVTQTLTNLAIGDFDANKQKRFRDKEYADDVSVRPYLNITYTSLLVDITSPINQSFLNNNISINLNFTIDNRTGTIDTCVFTTDNYATNATITNCQNTTFNRSDGNYLLQLWVNDSINEVNTASTNFTIDTTFPSISITSPLNNTNHSSNTIEINYTISETNVGSCWWSNSSGVSNNSISCGTNITGQTWDEGSNTVVIYGNDSANNENSTSTTFTVDTTNPTINFTNPTETDSSYINQNFIEVNVTATDSGVGLDSILVRLFNSTRDQINSSLNLTSPNYINFSGLSDGLYFFNATSNDTLNNINDSVTRNITLDTTFPLIDFGTGTEDDETNFTRSNIYVNVTVTETNEDTITFLLYNQTAQVNSTSFTDSTRTINWTSLPDEIYTYNVTINDSAGNSNTTATRTIRLDNNPPSVTIALPLAQSYSSNNSLPLNYSVLDTVTTVDSCWFNVINSTSDSQISNTSITDCLNTTFGLVGVSDTYTLTLFSNDSLGQENSDSVIFSVSLESPAIVLDYPPDNQVFNNGTDIYFNFTATDPDGLDTCQLYGNWTGTWGINYTWTSPNSGVQNFTTVNLTDTTSVWNVFCNDTFNNGGFALNNFTVIIDTIDPLITIQSITTTSGSQTFSFNATMTDANQESCWYSVFDSTGAVDSSVNENTTCTFGVSNSETVSAFGTYNLTVYGNDSANNENSTTRSFKTSVAVQTGGGGGGGISEPQIPFIGLIEPEPSPTVSFNDLDRGIIYSTINNYCAEKTTSNAFAIEDLSRDCQLTQNDLEPIIQLLKEVGLLISKEDLTLFIKAYGDSLFFQGFASQTDIDKFNLFTSILGILTPLMLNPPSIDTPIVIYEPSGIIRTIPFTVTSNKPMTDCKIISDNPNLNCEIDEDNILRVSYKLLNTQFFSRVFSGTILVTATDPESKQIEQRRLPVVFRVYNSGWKNFGIIIVGGIILIPIYFFVIRGRGKKKKQGLLKNLLAVGKSS